MSYSTPPPKRFAHIAISFCFVTLSFICKAEPSIRTSLLPLENPSSSDFFNLATSMQSDSIDEKARWNIHGQATYISHQKNNFNSPYYGQNSLRSNAQGGGDNSFTFSATAFLGAKLWDSAEFYYNPEIFQGTPFSGELVGLGGFQNGELQKGAYANPIFYSARAFLRQTFNLGGERELVESSANQVAGNIDKNRVVFSLGKFATLDFFDQNTYSHDPRTQFQNFALFSMGAYSYAADTKGYTSGGVIEWYKDNWIVKAARLALPNVPNTEEVDLTLQKNYIDQVEITRTHNIAENSGALRVLFYQQHAFMATFENAISQGLQDMASARQLAQRSWGYGLNFEQALSKDLGVFARWSWNTGNTETQTIDVGRSLSGGISLKGSSWARPRDTLGVGFAINGVSGAQITYLKQGGMSAFIGDGNLNYGNEQIFESYYSAKIYKDLHLSFDYQRIENPAYNSSRGPVDFLGIRAHLEM